MNIYYNFKHTLIILEFQTDYGYQKFGSWGIGADARKWRDIQESSWRGNTKHIEDFTLMSRTQQCFFNIINFII
jgi:hypothetical protein